MSRMNLILIKTVAAALPITVHTIGLITYYYAKDYQIEPNTYVLLVNLSLSELAIVASQLSRHILQLCHADSVYVYYLAVIEFLGASVLYLLFMIVLTVDRYLRIHFNIRYPTKVTRRRTKHLLLTIWLLVFIGTALFMAIHKANENSLMRICYLYLYPIVDMIFLVAALYTYFFALKKMRHNNKILAPPMGYKRKRTAKVIKVKQYKGLLAVTLIISTFLVFIVSMDQMIFYSILLDINLGIYLETYMFVSYNIGFSTDVFIYICMVPAVMKAFRKKILRRR
ncbi:melanocyte-stimulating hormone receptor-like [Hydractinia symbiolongicarpus]|uniref:melanocyte-stimulating hormone receptor-like n=1 Tax=Hydractinia symbiolongicarpus TaxID=13093 RepID=UPI00254F101D|nr:melanocyte-stimulating hormone receptor-like [Hydractinia symbiolongicarpus]